jgi:ATP-dependent DNA ligase
MIARTLRPRDRRSRNGPIVFEHACKLGLEGIVFQRRDSGYRSGRLAALDQVEEPRLRGDAMIVRG